MDRPKIRILLPDGRVLIFSQIVFDVEDIRIHDAGFGVRHGYKKPEERPAPAGCPRCAHALGLRPDLSERSN